MAGYMMVMGPCMSCGRTFSYNAQWVPSLRYPNADSPRQPVCGPCMEHVNAEREKMGLPPHRVHPLAYEPEEV